MIPLKSKLNTPFLLVPIVFMLLHKRFPFFVVRVGIGDFFQFVFHFLGFRVSEKGIPLFMIDVDYMLFDNIVPFVFPETDYENEILFLCFVAIIITHVNGLSKLDALYLNRSIVDGISIMSCIFTSFEVVFFNYQPFVVEAVALSFWHFSPLNHAIIPHMDVAK